MIRRLTALMLWAPSLVMAQVAPDPLDVPPARRPPCRAPLMGVCYEFTSSSQGWHIPTWSLSAGVQVRPSELIIHSTPAGDSALRVEASFPQRRWSAVVLELREIGDLGSFEALVARVRVPEGGGFAVRWAAVVGSDWTWSEVPDATPLREGEWNDVSVPVRSLGTNLADVHRLILRIESSGTPGLDGRAVVDIDFIRLVS